MTVTFVLGKHPYAIDAGDTRLTRILIEAAAESTEVRAVALSSGQSAPAPIPILAVPKPSVRLARQYIESRFHRRSLIHERFAVAALADRLLEDRSETVIAEHVYMAEAPIAAGCGRSPRRLLINAHVLESTVLDRTPSALRPLLRIEARRTARDELRCSQAAASTACFGSDDLNTLRRAGAPRLHRLDVLLPPAGSAAPLAGGHALFLGDRSGWAPNRLALKRLFDLWPGIVARAPSARLTIAGNPAPGEPEPAGPGVERVGFVPDLDELWRSATVLLAPVTIGGGVRVKILDAARHGVPVVGSPEAVGTIEEYLPITPSVGDEAFRDRAIELLTHPPLARREGATLYERNRDLWAAGFVARQVGDWIAS